MLKYVIDLEHSFRKCIGFGFKCRTFLFKFPKNNVFKKCILIHANKKR